MKKPLLLGLLLAGVSAARAQDVASREEALKSAFMLSADLKQMLSTPIPTDPDVKRPAALGKDGRGALVMPECKLTAEAIGKAGKDVVPVGQLWMRGLLLEACAMDPAPGRMLSVTLGAGDKASAGVLCALGVCRSAEGGLELLIYGKDKEPVQRVALKPVSELQDNPFELKGQTQGGGALLTLKLFGKHEASFMVMPD